MLLSGIVLVGMVAMVRITINDTGAFSLECP